MKDDLISGQICQAFEMSLTNSTMNITWKHEIKQVESESEHSLGP